MELEKILYYVNKHADQEHVDEIIILNDVCNF